MDYQKLDVYRQTSTAGCGSAWQGLRNRWLADIPGDVLSTNEEYVDPSPWTGIGLALGGTTGDPVLAGSGPLTAGSSNSLDLTNALPSTTSNLVIGLTSLYVGCEGGTMVPGPPWVFFANLPVDGSGDQGLPFTWPTGIPAGTNFWAQHWIADTGAAGSFGFAASNGLQGTAQ